MRLVPVLCQPIILIGNDFDKALLQTIFTP